MMNKVTKIIINVLFLAIIPFLAMMTIFTVVSTETKIVSAKVKDIEIVQTGTGYQSGKTCITYQYQIDGKSYESKKIEFGTRILKTGVKEQILIDVNNPLLILSYKNPRIAIIGAIAIGGMSFVLGVILIFINRKKE